jgi:selenocysteine lyase/cysteine desulfurase
VTTTTNAAVDTWRAEFPLTGEWAYLNTATYGPYPSRTVELVKRYAEAWANPATAAPEFQAILNQDVPLLWDVRRQVATLTNGRPEQVAFTGSLAEAMNLLAHGIDWRPGDNVVLVEREFPSVAYTFLNIERRHGVHVRWAAKDANGRTDLDAIAALIDGRTRAVAISQVEWADGYQNDICALGAICREQGVELFVDATHAIGPQPVDVTIPGVTAVVGHGYKWQLAGFGTCPVVFAPGAEERIEPTYAGRLGVQPEFMYENYRLDFQAGALRYQSGGMNVLGLLVLRSSLSLVLEIGQPWITAHTGRLVQRVIDGADEKGYRIVSDTRPEHRSQIVSISSGDLARDTQIVEDLKAVKVAVIMRDQGIRVSTYFFNTEQDVDRLIDALPGV